MSPICCPKRIRRRRAAVRIDSAGYDHPRGLTGQTQGLRHAPSQPIAVRGEAQSVFRRQADQPAINAEPGAHGEHAHRADFAVRAEDHVGGGERHRPELPQLVEAIAFGRADQRGRNGGSPLLDAGRQQFQKVHRASCCGLKRWTGLQVEPWREVPEVQPRLKLHARTRIEFTQIAAASPQRDQDRTPDRLPGLGKELDAELGGDQPKAPLPHRVVYRHPTGQQFQHADPRIALRRPDGDLAAGGFIEQGCFQQTHVVDDQGVGASQGLTQRVEQHRFMPRRMQSAQSKRLVEQVAVAQVHPQRALLGSIG